MGVIFDDLHRIANIPVQIALASEDLFVGDCVVHNVFNEVQQLPEVKRRTNNTQYLAGIVNKRTRAGQELILITEGKISGFDTSIWSEGDFLYPTDNGGITNVRTTIAGVVVQKIGTVIKSDATDGVFEVSVKTATEKSLDIAYNNTNSNLQANNVHDAIDEIESRSDSTEARTLVLETKMAGIEEGATADQDRIEIKTLYEANPNTNEYDDAEQFKVAQISVTQPIDLDFIEKKDEDRRNAIGNLNSPLVHIPFKHNIDFSIGTGNINFERSQTNLYGSTYIDRTNVLRYAQNNVPRFEKQGLLMEGTSTNMIIDSNSSTNWVKGSSVTVSDSVLSIDNINTSHNVSIPAVTVDNTLTILSTSGILKTYTFSIWMKSNVQQNVELSLVNGSGNFIGTNLFTTTTKWTRYSITADTDVLGAALTNVGGNSLNVDICFPQLENLPFMSSYIPTNGSPVTRNYDLLDLDFLGNALNADESQTWLCDFTVLNNTANINRGMLAVKGETDRYIQFNSDNTISSPGFGGNDKTKYVNDNFRFCSVNVNGVSTGWIDSGLYEIPLDAGVSNNTVTIDDPINDLRTIQVGSANGFALFGHVRNFRIFDYNLSDEEMRLS